MMERVKRWCYKQLEKSHDGMVRAFGHLYKRN